MKLKKLCVSLTVIPWLFASAGCETEKSARIMEDDEANMVDVAGAGAASFERLVKEAVTKLLDRNRGDENAIPIRRLAFVDMAPVTDYVRELAALGGYDVPGVAAGLWADTRRFVYLARTWLDVGTGQLARSRLGQ